MTTSSIHLSAEPTAQARNAKRISITFFIANNAGVLAFIYYLIFQGWSWQLFVLTVLSAILSGTSAFSLWLNRKGRHRQIGRAHV